MYCYLEKNCHNQVRALISHWHLQLSNMVFSYDFANGIFIFSPAQYDGFAVSYGIAYSQTFTETIGLVLRAADPYPAPNPIVLVDN